SPFLPLRVWGQGRGGTVRREWGGIVDYRGINRAVIFKISPAQPSTYLRLNFHPPSVCLSLPGSLSPSLSLRPCPPLFLSLLSSLSLSRSATPVSCLFSLGLSPSLSLCPLLSLGLCLPSRVSPPLPSCPPPLDLCGVGLHPLVPRVSLLSESLLHLRLSPSPHPARFLWPAGLLKEKERKAAPPAATVPGPGLEPAGPADASAGAVVGGGSPRGRPGAAPGPGLLAPLLWERTLPFGDVEYVDLDAFLLEHGLPPSPPPPGGPSPAPSPVRTPAPSPGPGSCGSASPRSSPGHAPARAALGAAGGHRAGLTSRDTPSPVDPDTVEVLMTFEPDPADLALSSIPGHETFDPRRHRFSEEELKPQPIMKKARKIQVPEEQKDEKYWSRRYKNNEAAKRSRDARRLKENQISVRAAFLEKENALLRQEVVAVRQELSHYRAVLSRYQAQHGAL
uniref:D-box binding PAR bZIP transcription factor n=1 Tax=Phocoena sinus TaxID=42100 RepID=A0A8C9E7Y0_PHOSS